MRILVRYTILCIMFCSSAVQEQHFLLFYVVLWWYYAFQKCFDNISIVIINYNIRGQSWISAATAVNKYVLLYYIYNTNSTKTFGKIMNIRIIIRVQPYRLIKHVFSSKVDVSSGLNVSSVKRPGWCNIIVIIILLLSLTRRDVFYPARKSMFPTMTSLTPRYLARF